MLQILNKNSINIIDISPLDLTEHYNQIKERLIDYNWFVGFGNALGLYRDKETIPGDTDIDICVLETNPDKIKKIEEIFEDYELVRTTKYNLVVQQLCFQKEDNVLIDICFFYPNGMDLINQSECGTFIDAKDTIGTPQLRNTKYGKLPFPEYIEKYLKRRYGDDWQVPKYGLISESLTQ